MKTPFEKHLDLIISDADLGSEKIKEIRKQIKELGQIDENFLTEKIDELVDEKQKLYNRQNYIDKNQLGSAMRAVHYSKRIEKLLEIEAKNKGISINKLYWKILSQYFGIKEHECDPNYWLDLHNGKEETEK